MFVLGENQYEKAPTLAYCKSYAKQHNLPLDKTYIDHGALGGYEILFGNLDPYIGADGMFGLPWNAVLKPSNMQYMFADTNNGAPNVITALQKLGIPIQ